MRRTGVGTRVLKTSMVVALAATMIATSGAPAAGDDPAPPDPVVRERKDGSVTGGPAIGGVAEITRAIADSASGTAEVLVMTALATRPEATMTPAAVASQRDAIERAQRDVAATVAGTRSRVVSTLDVVPSSLVVVDRDGLEALLADPSVASINLNRRYGLLLSSTTGIIDSDRLNAAGVLGNNWEGGGGRYEIAVIDTGFARDHNALKGRVVTETCFSQADACPGGTSVRTGAGAARPCTFSADCGHGTHVASTAAGARFTNGHEGVARGAAIDGIRIGHRSSAGTWTFTEQDLNKALQRVLTLKNNGRRIASLNMSIGGGAFTSSCGGAFPTSNVLTRRLREAGVAVVAASGNDGFINAVSWPACLPNVYAISATTDNDVGASFSNVSSKTAWFAPGVSVTAAIPGGPNRKATFSGTSMASPHVAGAFALLRECPGNGTPGKVADDLRATGRTVNDFGTIRKRINVFQAATRNVANNHFAKATAVPSTGTSDLHRFNVCASAESGEPPIGTPQATVWFKWRAPRSGNVRISTNDVGSKKTTFDTELALFRGGSLSSLTRIEYDDNSGDGRRSLIVARVTAGTTYRIRVDGVDRQNGKFNLHLVPPPA